MGDLLQFLAANPNIAVVVIVLLGLVILLVIFIAVIIQGREVSFGPLKIGSKFETKDWHPGGTKEEEVKVTSFSTRTDYTMYRTNRLRSAQKIDDVTWRFQGYSGQTFSHGEVSARKNEFNLISQIVKRPDVVWRGIAVFTSLERFLEEKALITDLENVGYNFGIYEVASKNSPPRMGFMIIDDKELLIAYPHKSIRLAIQHPQIVKLYSEYFEEIWQSSYKLKQGNRVDFQKLQSLEREIQ